jgi:hypothetical protein
VDWRIRGFPEIPRQRKSDNKPKRKCDQELQDIHFRIPSQSC